MDGADYWSCSYVYATGDTNNFDFHDWSYDYATDGTTFNWGETQNFESTSTITKNRDAGEYTCEFTRAINTGDADDFVIPLDTAFDIISAYGVVNA